MGHPLDTNPSHSGEPPLREWSQRHVGTGALPDPSRKPKTSHQYDAVIQSPAGIARSKIDKINALRRKPIDSGSTNVGMAMTAQLVEALVVGQDEEHIGPLGQ